MIYWALTVILVTNGEAKLSKHEFKTEAECVQAVQAAKAQSALYIGQCKRREHGGSIHEYYR